MTLESIKKYREHIFHLSVSYPWIGKMVDEIEHEIAELQRDHEFLQRIYDAAIADRNANWMKLPVDADGEPIRVGDTITWCDWDEPKRIEAISYGGEGEWWLFAEDGNECDSVKNCHHYRKPTVEDVLFSYRQDCIRAHEEAVSKQARDEMLQRIDAKYADKLREAVRGE